jgi:hypothetical protein
VSLSEPNPQLERPEPYDSVRFARLCEDRKLPVLRSNESEAKRSFGLARAELDGGARPFALDSIPQAKGDKATIAASALIRRLFKPAA